MYGNYDQRNDLPQFDLYLGPSLWDKVILPNAAFGTPFISSLELRLLKKPLTPLVKWRSFEDSMFVQQVEQFPQDIYDRAWWPYQETDWTQITTSSKIETGNGYQPPLRAMRSACIPANASLPLSFPINSTVPDVRYYVYVHFAEIQELEANHPAALDAGQIYLERTANSTLPPIFNAIELYTVKEFLQLQTRNWKGIHAALEISCGKDLIAPMNIIVHLELHPCKHDSPFDQELILKRVDRRDTSLHTKSIPITISVSIHMNCDICVAIEMEAKLVFVEIPWRITIVVYRNLNDNSLNGSVPAELVEKSKNGLTLSVEGNPSLCAKASCIKKKKNKTVVPLVASVVSFAVLTVVAILWRVQRMTNNFQRVLGKGVFGTVFHGCFNDTQVAVKMLSESLAQGYKQFHAEVELLLRVHHRNLTPLIGYCDDGSNLGLVYEFMAKGNLAEHLSGLSARFFTQQELVTFDAFKNKVLLHEYLFVDAGNSSNILTWEQRLRRALEAA
ncbi:hypothetical protein Gotri_003608, partial [Gossypium trilobum]|nr:hypothetical protein [Gossypium trilobum]